MSNYNTSAIIESSLENVNALKEHLEKISDLRNNLRDTLDEVKKVPIHFEKLGMELSDTSDQFLYRNYELLKEQIIFFQEKIIDLNNRIAQIDEIDFRKRFENANTDYFQNLEKISNEKLNQFDHVKTELNTAGQNITGEVDRLKLVDLESHFNKHDKRLSDVFGGINNINSSLLNTSNQLLLFQEKMTTMEQKLQLIENKISEQERNLLYEIKSITENQNITLKKQGSNFIILAILMVLSIAISIGLHFLK